MVRIVESDDWTRIDLRWLGVKLENWVCLSTPNQKHAMPCMGTSSTSLSEESEMLRSCCLHTYICKIYTADA